MSSEELSASVGRLVDLSKQIKGARTDIKVLVQAEKNLKEEVKKIMIKQGLDVINLKDKGKISINKSAKKSGLNKQSVKEGLTIYFDGNDEKAEIALKTIIDSLPQKESTSISLRGIKAD